MPAIIQEKNSCRFKHNFNAFGATGLQCSSEKNSLFLFGGFEPDTPLYMPLLLLWYWLT